MFLFVVYLLYGNIAFLERWTLRLVLEQDQSQLLFTDDGSLIKLPMH